LIPKAPFLIKPETTYTLSFSERLFDPFFEVEICMYENEAEIGVLTLTADDFDIKGSVTLTAYYTFQSLETSNYMAIYFYGVDLEKPYQMPDIQLEEGQRATSYEPYVEGSLMDTTSPYFQSSGVIISYVDEPISVSEIQSSLKAFDKIDGDVSDRISLKEDGYSDQMDELGEYPLVFSVSDSSGNTTEVTIKVNVIDVLPPVFTNVENLYVPYPAVFTEEEVKGLLSASDNYEGDVSDKIELVSNQYHDHANEIGTYTMVFQVSDSSGNTTTQEVLIHVVDQEAPLITGEETLVVGYNQLYSEEEMLSLFTVSDNYDKDIALVIEKNDYQTNHQTLGTYEVVFRATDQSGNSSEKTLEVKVVDDIGPLVYLDFSAIQVYTDHVLGLPDFADLFVKTNELASDKDYLITVLYDSYTKHAKEPGIYHLHLQFEDEEGELLDKNLQIQVVEKQSDGIVLKQELDEVSWLSRYQKELVYGGVVLGFILVNGVWFFIYQKRK